MQAEGQKRFAKAFHPFQVHRVAAFLTLFIAAGTAAVLLPKEKHSEEAAALLERARAVSELEVEAGSPFRLEAVVHVRVGDAVADGHYLRVWQSRNRWRDELTFSRYSQDCVGTESAMWRRRNTNHQPLPVIQFINGLLLNLPHDAWKGRKLTLTHGLQSGNPSDCVKVETNVAFPSAEITQTWCFDSSSGVLTRRSLSDWDTTWEYLEYTPWNGKQYPRQINVEQGGLRVVEARITLADAPNLDPAQFSPPHDAEEWPRCEHARPPTMESSDPHLFGDPHDTRRTLTPIFIEVGADGHVQDVTVLRPLADPKREYQIFLDLKRRWKFRPATCGNEPMPMSMIFEFPI